MNSEVNYEGLIQKLGLCCNNCYSCGKEQCLVGYGKRSLTLSQKHNSQFVDSRIEKLPITDFKVYDEAYLVDAIAYTLSECKNCNIYHDEDCIVNILRSCIEVGLLGAPQEYKGSVLNYLSDIGKLNEGISKKVQATYMNMKKEGV